MTVSDGAVLAASAALDSVESVAAMFQPVVELSTGTVVGYEALARWPSPSLALPEDVFALARERGMVGRVDVACRAAALRAARERSYSRRVRFFLNIEPGCFVDERDVDTHLDAIGDDLDVVLEITERDLDRNVPMLMALVRGARARGMAVAMDDVGATPATLHLLASVAPDIVKLDASIVRSPYRSRAAMRQVRDYVRSSDAVLLAEGIETTRHLRRATALGATLGQGWMFGRPMPLPNPSV
ncbi:EAL domain-containing protein [Rhodococcus sp. ARC_M12]|uniref:EAL domain-containing protein n=1 Tax=unclassified Rhodococcus (in: high G+C Gram-positive bacteria) TaxID=192944 RepID=UPI001FB4C5E4|nr:MULTISPECIES: EAL domain-containing protein [unclassified Rhodococcus (in: high G+C Gram-positive bacteria)]MCJ0890887.1 EAL domain-containing protein [Rhodococcus sp. ARC_M5]MCJ0980656.1 EAL domain-containing protein [Rhodococcus sp. ARC_M12]